jgi:hypothetical protein
MAARKMCLGISLSFLFVAGVEAQMYVVGSDVTSAGSTLYRVDDFATVPVRVDIAVADLLFSDLAITPGGTAYVVAYPMGPLGPYELHSLNLSTAASTLVMSLPDSQNSLEAASETILYSWGFLDSRLYRIDLAAHTALPVIDFGHFGSDLALAPDGKLLYGASLDDRLLRLDLETLVVTDLGALNPGPGLRFPGIDFDMTGTLFGITGIDASAVSAIYRIDVTDASATLLGDVSGAGSFGMTIQGPLAVAVPALDPANLALLALLLVGSALILIRGLR